MSERIATASSSWTCWPFERTNLRASRHCQVVPIYVYLHSLSGDRPGTKLNVSWFFGRGEKKENRSKKT